MNESLLNFEDWCKTIPVPIMERCRDMSPNTRNVFLQTLFAGYGIGYLEICELKAKLMEAEQKIAIFRSQQTKLLNL